MKPIKKILVALDLSERSKSILQRAFWVAERWGANLEVVHILQDMPYDGASQNVGVMDLMEKLEGEARQELDRLTREIIQDKIKVETHVQNGLPYREILRRSQEVGADLVMIGSETQSGISGLFLGRTAEATLRRSLFPVWVERGEFTKNLKRILLPTDLSDNSRAGVLSGLEWARQTGAEVILLHVIDAPYIPSFSLIDTQDYTESMGSLGKKQFDDFIEGLPLEGVSCESNLSMGTPTPEIIRLAEEKKIDLIVLSSHGLTNLPLKLMGSVAIKLLRHVSSPTLVVRPPDLDLSWLKSEFYS